MNLVDIIKYWIESANEALETAETLLSNKNMSTQCFSYTWRLRKYWKDTCIKQEEAPYGYNLSVLKV